MTSPELGVTPDDIAVVSKHDTSTNANDPNESELHNTLAHAIGRTDGNPLFVISQKSLTGHAKGGACIFQVNGLTQLFKSGVVPANAALDCVDPKLKRDDHMVWLQRAAEGRFRQGGPGHVARLRPRVRLRRDRESGRLRSLRGEHRRSRRR